jgi:N-acetylglucosamine kinase-like BadF-type ATPase
MSRVLGLDIGGTASRAQLCVDGDLVAESNAASASVVAVGPASASAALTNLLGQLPLVQAPRLDAICVGSAGASVPATKEFLTERLSPLTRSGQVIIVKDAMLILPAAGLGAGIALIAGTGSIAFGSYQGRDVQSGGWGFLLGDEGSGYWIVRTAVRVLLDRRDCGASLGELGESLLEATGTYHIGALHEQFYARAHPRYWASYAPLVLDCADPAAQTITAGAAAALAGLAVSAAERLGAPPGLPVVLSGGLFRHASLESAVRGAIGERRPGTDVRTLTRQAVTGAVRLAMAAARAGELGNSAVNAVSEGSDGEYGDSGVSLRTAGEHGGYGAVLGVTPTSTVTQPSLPAGPLAASR